MRRVPRCGMLSPLLALAALLQAAPAAPPPAATPADPVEADWVTIPDDEILVFTLMGNRRVVIRLAPQIAPVHVGNMRKLALSHWWDGGSVYRLQDNYVAQWGDATEKKPLPPGLADPVPAEYVRPGWSAVVELGRPDPYSAKAGFTAEGWPVATDGSNEWMTHCYGYVGVGRNLAPDTGNGAELYAVIGHGPRHLDRNIALVGRVIEGIEWLSSLPRGTGQLGFYEHEAQRVPIAAARLASDMPAAERPRFQYRAPGNDRFAAYVKARENRTPPFFDVPAGGADICNVPAPVRKAP